MAIAGSVGFLLFRVLVPNDAAAIPFYAGAWRPDGVVVEPIAGPATGLRSGDVVTGIDGVSLGDWVQQAADPRPDRTRLSTSPVVHTVERAGVKVDLAVALVRPDVGAVLVDYWSALLFTIVLQAVAAYVLFRRPEAPAAAALALTAVGVTGSTIPWLLGLVASDLAAGWPFLLYGATAGGIYMVLWPAGALHLPLAMTRPGTLRPRLLAAIYGIPLGTYIGVLVASRLLSASATSWVGFWSIAQGIVIVPTVLAGIAVTIWGYRRAEPALRQRIRWLTASALVSVSAGLLLLFVPQLLLGRPLIPWSLVGLVALPLPLGVAAAILRYGLFEIEVVVNRALVYGGVTAAIVAVYVASVSLLGRALGVQAEFSASLLATGIAAVVALPIRDALQRGVNRLMYGDRDDPYRALVRLSHRLETAIDPVQAPDVIVRTVAESLRLPWVALRIGSEESGRTIAHGRTSSVSTTAIPLVYGTEEVGELVVAQRSATEPLSTGDLELLRGLARQVSPAVRALALTVELAASRERIVVAREEERRRIRRDLHDGLGPTLAAIGMRAELAADLVGADGSRAQDVLEEMRAEVRGALGDIRRLVDALRPPALDELGLVGALQAQASHLGPTPEVRVVASGPLPELPAAVEVAAYRIAVEAMTNAARHASAATCTVSVAMSTDPPSLSVEIVDDGRGLPAHVRPGIGSVSMRERAAEVGGTCEIRSLDRGGVCVRASLPLEVPVAEEVARDV